jgi:hypothetical protein
MSSTMDRSVAGLNSEQLYRKRALDRANQRASRARKKTRIQELEEEVLDLQQRPFNRGTYVMVGECYVESVMRGERVSERRPEWRDAVIE